jgi:hypothetical protein
MNRRDDAVKLPSFSIAQIMVIVAIAAVDCLVIRGMPDQVLYPLVFGGLPFQIVLVMGLMICFRRRKRGDKPLPSLLGFEFVGWISLLVYGAVCFQSPRSLDQHLGRTLGPVVRAIGVPRSPTADIIFRVGIAMAYLTMLQMIPALVAGWVCTFWSRLGLSDFGESHE